MPDVVVRAQGLSKRYSIQASKYRRDTIGEEVTFGVKRLFGLAGRRHAEDIVWAVRDVSFDIRAGEVVGIIGRNRAGKSTLLKILSRITEPTAGRAELVGRVGSLLEVGTGFHPELTGWENIYLNGSILGMKRAEIDRKFDEIVAFADIERFLDTPVKRYSSGMYVRLAFSVAAHLEPEILIVDEVLEVGDAVFQKKCLGKMQGVAKAGRTVLFVSHNMAAVTRLCGRAILLEDGRVIRDGPPHEVVGRYLAGVREWPDPPGAAASEVVRLRAVRIRTEDGRITDVIDIRCPVGLEMEYEVLKPGHVLVASFTVRNEGGLVVFTVHDRDPAWSRRLRPRGRFFSTAWIPGNFLAEGMLTVDAGIITEAPLIVHCDEPDAVGLHVIDTGEGDSVRGDFAGHWAGVVRPLLPWTTEFTPDRESRNGSGSRTPGELPVREGTEMPFETEEGMPQKP